MSVLTAAAFIVFGIAAGVGLMSLALLIGHWLLEGEDKEDGGDR